MNLDGSDQKVFARGLRNTVFFTWSLVDGRMWGTDNGRDLLGDDLPPDEINIIEEGGNYGWPNCYGKNVHDTDFDKNTYIRNPCMDPFEKASQIDLPAHSAPLGLAFVPEEGWPEEYWYNLIVAFHGSWNRSVPTGYKLVRIKLDARGNYLGQEDFVTDWLPQGNSAASGRPAGVLALPGGILYVSDDKGGFIYRIRYERP
jgi:glucose/arabinose dehydrogenase